MTMSTRNHRHRRGYRTTETEDRTRSRKYDESQHNKITRDTGESQMSWELPRESSLKGIRKCRYIAFSGHMKGFVEGRDQEAGQTLLVLGHKTAPKILHTGCWCQRGMVAFLPDSRSHRSFSPCEQPPAVLKADIVLVTALANQQRAAPLRVAIRGWAGCLRASAPGP